MLQSVPRSTNGSRPAPGSWLMLTLRAQPSGSNDADVLELPRVVAVEVFREQLLAVLQRGPVAPDPAHFAEIRPADFQNAGEIEFLGLDDAARRVLDGPDHSGQHRGGHLQ